MSIAVTYPGGSGGPAQPCAKPAAPKPGQGIGMSAPTEVDAFADDMARLQEEWPLLTGADRLLRLQAMVDARAASAGFPAPDVTAPKGLGRQNGTLNLQGGEIA